MPAPARAECCQASCADFCPHDEQVGAAARTQQLITMLTDSTVSLSLSGGHPQSPDIGRDAVRRGRARLRGWVRAKSVEFRSGPVILAKSRAMAPAFARVGHIGLTHVAPAELTRSVAAAPVSAAHSTAAHIGRAASSR